MELLQVGWGGVHDDGDFHDVFHQPIVVPSFYDNLPLEEGSEWTVTMRKWWLAALETNTFDEKMLALVRLDDIAIEDYFRNDFNSSRSQMTLNNYFQSGELSDLTIATNGLNFRVHLPILTAHTDFFSVCLRDCWSESRVENTVRLDCDPEIFKLLLRYYYFGEIDTLPADSLISCITLSHQLMSHSLTSILEKLIATHLDSDNVCSILSLAEALNLSFLKERCLTTALKNLQNIQHLEYFQDLPPNVRAAIRELRRSYEQSKSLYGDTFHYIRELLSMIKDAIDEGEEVYRISKQRNLEEIEQCNVKLSRIGLVYPFPSDLSLEYTYDRNLVDWRVRLQSVEETLQIQRTQLDQRKEFYQQQKHALDALYGSEL